MKEVMTKILKKEKKFLGSLSVNVFAMESQSIKKNISLKFLEVLMEHNIYWMKKMMTFFCVE